MARIEEKVKDLIEVKKYEPVRDFLAEPNRTIGAYYYTPETAELMVSWLTDVARVENGNGKSKALAGYRGVGKSHFLATFGTMLEHPELRATISDSHVFSSLHHLKRRHYPVAYVRRGSNETFSEELITGICKALGIAVEDSSIDIESLLRRASESAKELPFVILVDTHHERESRVSRDDGVLLGELASIAKGLNIFIGVALDDDITDADGANAAIADSFSIDYLDQEHLYKIVENQIFPKHRQSRGLIQDIYKEFRSTLPSFRWSEQRFNSLYPLHPSILEIAPFVRYYSQTFALLGFASKAGERIMGRPANSLISLDEVFDNEESTLRKSLDLADSFAIYDQVLTNVIAKIPVMQRLQSKLILKALFILSLDGNGTTAAEISETLLIFDERDPEGSIEKIRDTLRSFSNEADGVWCREEAGSDVRFGINITGKDDLNSALDEAKATLPPDAIEKALLRVAKDKYSDWKISGVEVAEGLTSFDSKFSWNGTIRHAEIFWNKSPAESSETAQSTLDARIGLLLNADHNQSESKLEPNEARLVAAPLTNAETESLQRLYVLLANTSLREHFGEQVRAAGHTNLVAAKKIWNRIFFDDARLFIGDKEYSVPAGARQDGLFSHVLEDLYLKHFSEKYPAHPSFEAELTMEQVGTLVNDLFAGVRGGSVPTQELAQKFALPLGLVREVNGELNLASEEEIGKNQYLSTLIEAIGKSNNQMITLESIRRVMDAPPYGFSREAQYLILSALVALRMVEFVTTRGDRISHRSLDLRILWNDIVGIAKPVDIKVDYAMLSHWARAVSKVPTLKDFNAENGRGETIEALRNWRDDWIARGVLERFGELPDEALNRRIWAFSVSVEKSFGVVARILKGVGENGTVLEDILQRISETFSDSLEEIEARFIDLERFEQFIESTSKRQRIWSYLAVCETTTDDQIEKLRRSLLAVIDNSYDLSAFENNDQIDNLWNEFRERFIEYFTLRHDAIMNSQQISGDFDQILKSDEWWEFEFLSKLQVFNTVHWKKAQKIVRRYRELKCAFDVRANLISHPFCACSFNLTSMNELAKLANSLANTVEAGRRSYRSTLKTMHEFIEQQIIDVAAKKENPEMRNDAESLIESLRDSSMQAFTGGQLNILHAVLIDDAISTTIQVKFPTDDVVYTSNELRLRVNSWVDDLPDSPVMLKLQ